MKFLFFLPIFVFLFCVSPYSSYGDSVTDSTKTDGKWWNDPSTKSAGELKYQILTSLTGDQRPTLRDTVTVHYAGELTDGTPFDSSYRRGKPASFGLTQVIPGWTQILQEMSIGDKWKVWIPSHLAYGSEGRNTIPPNADLVFTIELIDIPTQKDL